MKFKINDSVYIKENITDPDSGAAIGGWIGRITVIDTSNDEMDNYSSPLKTLNPVQRFF